MLLYQIFIHLRYNVRYKLEYVIINYTYREDIKRKRQTEKGGCENVKIFYK